MVIKQLTGNPKLGHTQKKKIVLKIKFKIMDFSM